MTPEYIAGLFDGEGCVSLFTRVQNVTRHGKLYQYRYWVLDVRIGMANGDEPLRVIFDRYGGSIHTESLKLHRRKIKTQWYLRDGDAYQFLRDIEPHCMVKRREIGLALQYLRMLSSRVLPSDWQERAAAIAVDMKRDKPGTGRKSLFRPPSLR